MKRVTLEKRGEAEYTEKKSVFIGYACPITSEEEAIEFVKAIKKKHADARHNVYAYRLNNGTIARYSDDGEPQGTAGIPVLDIIRKGGFDDAVIVVTRYFGGILLGAGGLVRAYSTAAKMAVEAAGIVTYDLFTCFDIKLNYTDNGKILPLVAEAEAMVDEVVYEDTVTQRLLLPVDEFEAFEKKVKELTAARAEIIVTGQRYDKRK